MKKKIMGVILAATLIVSQAVTAFAGSKTSEVVLPNDFAAYYTVTEGTREAFAEAEAVSPQTVDAIIEVNNRCDQIKVFFLRCYQKGAS